MKRLILMIIIVLSLLLTACGEQELYLCPDGSVGGGQQPTTTKLVYFCPDGTLTPDYNVCVFTAQTSITQKDAELKAINFANGYLQSNNWQSTLVNAHFIDGEWLAQIVVSKYDESSFETTISVDGETGFASCNRNCDYIS